MSEGLPSPPVAGSCACGDVRLAVSPPFPALHLCHCTQCRRSNGSAFNLALIVDTAQVEWQSRKSLTEFESSPGKLRAFCRTCGSPVYSRRGDLPAVYRLRAGLFPDLPRPEQLTQGFRESAWPWTVDLAALILDDAGAHA